MTAAATDHIEQVEGGYRLLSHEGKNLGTFNADYRGALNLPK
jgi:hypothetical protein